MAKVRLTATVDEPIAQEVRQLAEGMHLSVASLLGILITAAIKFSSHDLVMIGETIEGLIAADEEHDAEQS